MSRRRQYTDSQGRRLRRPQSWALIPAVLMAVLTTITAAVGINTFLEAQETGQPRYEVKIVVEGTQDWNISQRTVDAAMDAPILSHQPLTLTVTDRFLSGDERLRGILPGKDIVLSTQLENKDPADSTPEYRFTGTAVRADLAEARDHRAYEEPLDVSFEIDNAFRDNLGLGHGPKAVVAAAQRAAIVLYDPPNTNPVFWISLIGLGASATAVFLLLSVRYSLRWEAKHRRLAAAQRKLARVVLDLEALEATYYAAPAKDRPEGFKNSWNQLRKLSLDLARSEDPLVAALFSRSSCFTEQTAKQLGEFEAAARRLTSLSDALMGAGSVHARLAGTGSTFDQLSSPVNEALNRLLIRLEQAPGQMVANADIEELRAALGRLLDAASGDAKNHQAIAAWHEAEQQIVALAIKLKKQLSRYPHGKVLAPAPAAQDYLELKKSLGLDASAAKDGYANAAYVDALVRSITGDTLESDRQAPQKKSAHRRIDALYRPRGVLLALGLAGVLLVGMIPAGITAAQLTGEPFADREGTGLGANLQIDDPSGELSNTEIIRYVDSDFPVPTNMVVAVRDAEAYLKLKTEQGADYRTAQPKSILDALHRIKQEFPALLNPETKELNSGTAIIPVFYTDEGTAIVPGLISPEVSAGKYTIGGSSNWEYGSIYESKYPEITIAHAVDDYAVGLEHNGFEEDTSVSFGQLFWLFTWLFFFTVLNLALGVRFLLTASGSLGRFGRGTAELRGASAKLERLLIGLDDAQINAVAVLGASKNGEADDAGQRLFERALAMALREERELEATPAIERLRRGFSARVAHLDHLADVLADRDADVARRAQALIRATRGAGGDEPKDVALPGE
ncbi:hypothetical protein AUR04nite_03900 [Glutamicibacter uratoxydans]|uniref:Uncharacterized protein n=1 Tax=Glutamicibacter uratoxydans TaxID=43667 RepID=A0A4Y4DNE6_GLUUR|nr:DUF5129 domain-containing protein [Glutamicibacter uratoxydans]GED04858.1 hypothetical protein AUR04nite_03900 [Glutamicibacter uratoxydans]